RHASPATLSRAQEHSAHRQVHRHGTRQVQGLLEVTLFGPPRPQSLSASNPSAVSSRLREVCLPGEQREVERLMDRALLRTLRLALRDGGGRAGTGSGTPSITLAFAPASRCAISSLITSIERSISSSVIALTPPECSICNSRGT